MDLNASDGIQISVGSVLTLTLGAIVWYAWEARKQAEASRRIAEASLRPVLLLWALAAGADEPARGAPYMLYYHNIGNGPAMNILFGARQANVEWPEPPRRVGMGVRDQSARILVRFPLPLPESPLLMAEYDDAAQRRWRTTLQLQRRDNVLHNGDSTVERIRAG